MTKTPKNRGLNLAYPNLTDTPAYDELFTVITALNPLEVHAVGLPDYFAKLAGLRDALPVITIRLINDAREQGMTWQQIGDALGISFQAAQQLSGRAQKKVLLQKRDFSKIRPKN